MIGSLQAATLVTALGCGLVAGVFFAFSSFVMQALSGLPTVQGAATMQSINRQAITPLFMAALFGTALACLGLAVWAAVFSGGPGTVCLVSGGGVYLVGAILVTIVRNVPLNDALGALDPKTASETGFWPQYVRAWTAWNHVRGASALGAAALLTLGLIVG
jgi:uncharacterized membrane protein